MPICLDIETDSLDPTNGVITMVGTMDKDGVRVFTSDAETFRADSYAAEDNLLHRLSDANFRYTDSLLTYNGVHFDMVFLATRLMRHKIAPPAFMGIKRHIDLMLYATHLNGGTRISKDMAASKFCGLYSPRNSSGAFLAQIYGQRIVTDLQHTETIFHNLSDVCVTSRMFDTWKSWPSFKEFYSKQFPDINEWLK